MSGDLMHGQASLTGSPERGRGRRGAGTFFGTDKSGSTLISPQQLKACYSKLNFVSFLRAQELGLMSGLFLQNGDAGG